MLARVALYQPHRWRLHHASTACLRPDNIDNNCMTEVRGKVPISKFARLSRCERVSKVRLLTLVMKTRIVTCETDRHIQYAASIKEISLLSAPSDDVHDKRQRIDRDGNPVDLPALLTSHPILARSTDWAGWRGAKPNLSNFQLSRLLFVSREFS